jgi:hypothetical protein
MTLVVARPDRHRNPADAVDAPPGHGEQNYARRHHEHLPGGDKQPEAYDEHGGSRGWVLGAQEDK